jgi:hypothetical protein
VNREKHGVRCPGLVSNQFLGDADKKKIANEGLENWMTEPVLV